MAPLAKHFSENKPKKHIGVVDCVSSPIAFFELRNEKTSCMAFIEQKALFSQQQKALRHFQPLLL